MGLDQTLTLERPGLHTKEFDWRKANALHRWMVENVQDGQDDCGTYEVSIEQLRQLQGTLKRVVNRRELGPQLLPTLEGFFFGSTEYDVDYLEDAFMALQDVTEVLDNCRPGDRVTYSSSW